ncbi:MAG: DUF982 domain-containing protein [Phyllobacterium sp.]
MPFSAVIVLDERTNQRKIIDSLEEAAEFILYDWPVVPGDTIVAARQACLAALLGKIDPQVARDAFVEAARQARILIEA